MTSRNYLPTSRLRRCTGSAGLLLWQNTPPVLAESPLLWYGLLASVPIVVASFFIVFLLYRQKREAHFRQVQLQTELERADLEMQALRAQVNPHFIFNCLASIQHYIHRHESDLAEGYLVKFSRLIRLVLENSTQAMVPMEDDLEALDLYIQMEQLRLNNSFTYTIDTDGLDTELLYIPPLLIQPFVENAIWHGLAHTEAGHIRISFRLDGPTLSCFIADDGKPGEGPAPEHAAKNKSMGTALITRRLELYKKLHDRAYHFTMSDLEGQGKQIELTIPHEKDE
ncbi:sensor histidine kinase [Roseivirga sp. BDSF3-8]|uniref:sensor histidine kinase n=1 Tax=Roseivirga sp. BDSF3-8 TaxID=3241598 RepID=UPI0035321E3D